MPRDGTIEVEGVVVDVLPVKGKTLYRVRLSNGHRVLGYPRNHRQKLPVFVSGDRIALEMSPCDFSKGRIKAAKETEK